jgi:ABC-type tungstate transport system substrate-binding protein
MDVSSAFSAAFSLIFNLDPQFLQIVGLASHVLLAAMLLVFVFTLHLQPAMDGNPGQLLKDAGLAMAAIIIGNRTKAR